MWYLIQRPVGSSYPDRFFMILLRTKLIPLIHHSHLSNYVLLFNITLKVDKFLKYVSLAYFAKMKVGLPNNIFLYITMTANNR
jgi:hypothetical protein